MGSTFGATLFGAILNSGCPTAGFGAVSSDALRGLIDGAASRHDAGAVRAALERSLHVTFVTMFVVALGVAAVTLLIPEVELKPRRAPADLSGLVRSPATAYRRGAGGVDTSIQAPVPALAKCAIFLRLGLDQLRRPDRSYRLFRAEFVERRRWLDERAYVDLVALCQFLPGPASGQVGFSIGLIRAGHPGAAGRLGRFHAALGRALLIAFAYGAARCRVARSRGRCTG